MVLIHLKINLKYFTIYFITLLYCSRQQRIVQSGWNRRSGIKSNPTGSHRLALRSRVQGGLIIAWDPLHQPSHSWRRHTCFWHLRWPRSRAHQRQRSSSQEKAFWQHPTYTNSCTTSSETQIWRPGYRLHVLQWEAFSCNSFPKYSLSDPTVFSPYK